MNILMYGWEFPPFNSGGLGVACKGLVEGLHHHGTNVSLVLPGIPAGSKNLMPSYCIDVNSQSEINENEIRMQQNTISISPYISEKEFLELHKALIKQGKISEDFKGTLVEQAYNYGAKAGALADKIPHEIIHAHDWLTYPAGIETKKISNKPLVVHVHSTEFDRSAGNPNPAVYEIEREGFNKANSIIAVSNYTKKMVVDNYGIDEDKITVIHNAINYHSPKYYYSSPIRKSDKIVLFLGRITIQKGPDYFLKMAQKVLKKIKNVKFIVAGDGDMRAEMIKEAIRLGIEKNILFTGFLRGDDINKAFQNADLYVMPSVSEPFGLTALEAIQNGTPVLMSKQSGVSEVVLNALKVDFWDIDEMANKVISVLKYTPLSKTLKTYAQEEVNKLSWKDVGKKMKDHYRALTLAYA